MRWFGVAVASSMLLCGVAKAQAEVVSLSCADNSFVEVDMAARTATRWSPAHLSGVDVDRNPLPAEITASRVTWSQALPPYTVSYTLDRATGEFCAQLNTNTGRPVCSPCKRAAPPVF